MLLAGDNTEDPTRPKIQWPSGQNCPNCRIKDNSIDQVPGMQVNGEIWDQIQLIEYIRSVYKADSIINDVVAEEDVIRSILKEFDNTMIAEGSKEFESLHFKISEHCNV